MTLPLDPANYLAISFLESLGNQAPSEQEIATTAALIQLEQSTHHHEAATPSNEWQLAKLEEISDMMDALRQKLQVLESME